MLNMPFPDIDIRISNLPIAFVITPARKLEIRKIKLIQSKFFVMRPWGVFEIEPSKGIAYGKQVCYFYDARNAKPIDVNILKDLEDFTTSNRLHHVKRSDVKHASKLRQIMAKLPLHEALEKLKIVSGDNQAKIQETINETTTAFQKLESENKKVPELEGGYYLLESLSKAGLVSEHEKTELDHKLTNGLLNFGDLVEELQKLETISIQTPISLSVERFLEDFHTYSPSEVDGFIDRAERLGKKIASLSSPTVKQWIPASIIFALLVGGAIAFMVVMQTDISNLGINIPGFTPPQTTEPITNVIETTEPELPPDQPKTPPIDPQETVEETEVVKVWDPELEKWVDP